jgi:phosphoglycolate phosphatase
MRNIFFDLDGTLVDSRPRLYKLFCDLLPTANLSFTKYWDLKRLQVGHEKIIAGFQDPELNFEEFNGHWMKKIEEKEYLELDTPFPGVKEMLARLKEEGNYITVVTARQFPELAKWQISKWGWQEYVDHIIVTEQSEEKFDMIRASFPVFESSDIIVGDTGKDIETGHQLGIISVAVLSGFRNKEALAKYKPDYIFDSVTEIDFKKIV